MEAQAGTQPDTWVGVDALGRTLPTSKEVGTPRKDKFVGMFYCLWLGAHENGGPYDISKILAANPNAMNEPENPAWGPHNAFHHWGESIFGYYRSEDPWVLRKHAHLLADAGIDTVVFDASNGFTYKDAYLTLCSEWEKIRKEGGRTPCIAFLCPFGNPNGLANGVVRQLWKDLYSQGLYKDLWFKWKGKPLILVDPNSVDADLKRFFTFRMPIPDYYSGPFAADQWGWLEVSPQHVFRNSNGEAEEVTVGVGQNGTNKQLSAFSEDDTHGRSWHDGKRDTRKNAVAYGFNFQEQWDRALKIDPEFVFVTEWNEWTAMRLDSFNGVDKPVMFADLFTEESSRDIEPMKGGHGDDYYMQLVANVRKFKGAAPVPIASAPKTIRIGGDFSEWNDVHPEFRSDVNDMTQRDHRGYGSAGPYIDKTGRNNIVACKVARDRKNIYFYVRTSKPITPHTDHNWMTLFIDIDRNHKTGWEGYDFLVNERVIDRQTTVLQKNAVGWNWKDAAKIRYHVSGNELELAIPKSALGIKADDSFDFKWVDNVQKPGDIIDFYVSGDAAPIGRFNFRYQTK
jgi:hypothetical protein